MKTSTILIHMLFCAAFVGFITMAAIHFNKTGLMWWYLIPSFLAFCSIVSSGGDGKKK